MEARKFLQRQNTLLERQSSLLELDVIPTVGDFLHHQAIGGNVEHRNDAKTIDNNRYQLHNLPLRLQLLWSEVDFLADLLENVCECRRNDLVDLNFFGEIAAKLELVGQFTFGRLDFRHKANDFLGRCRRRILHENSVDARARIDIAVLTRLLDGVRLDLHIFLTVLILKKILQEQRIDEFRILVCHFDCSLRFSTRH
jgi:hypothetical protein